MAEAVAVKVEIEKADDRDTMLMILGRNGYTVRQVREKVGKNSRYTYYVEFWKGGRGTDDR